MNETKPGNKYFKGRCIQGQQVLHYVVWDGVRNYENAPPLQAIAQLSRARRQPVAPYYLDHLQPDHCR